MNPKAIVLRLAASLLLPALPLGCGEALEESPVNQESLGTTKQELGNIVYSNTFQTVATPGAEWSKLSGSTPLAITQAPSTHRFLGRFNNDKVRLSVGNIPPGHNRLRITAYVHFIHSWDGDGAVYGYGPDYFGLWADNTALMFASFRNSAGDTQGYPGPGSAARTGAVGANSLGFADNCNGTFNGIDSTYLFEYEIAHTGPTATIDFGAQGLQLPCDESWGIDDLKVEAYSTTDKFKLTRVATGQGGWPANVTFLTGDFTGDGKTDVARVFGESVNGVLYTSIDVWDSTGTGLALYRRWTRTDVRVNGNFYPNMRFVAGDFDGNGRDDIASAFVDNGASSGPTNIGIHYSTGSGFEGSYRAITGAGAFSTTDDFVVGDFDANGKEDIMRVFVASGNVAGMDAYLSTGKSMPVAYQANFGSSLGGNWPEVQWLAGDWDGDGDDDLASASKTGTGLVNLNVYPSDRTRLTGFSSWAQSGSWLETPYFVAGDFNQDNRDDIGMIFGTVGSTGVKQASADIYQSTGGGFSSFRAFTQQGNFWPGVFWMTGDFDGHRRTDFAHAFIDSSASNQASIDIHFNNMP